MALQPMPILDKLLKGWHSSSPGSTSYEDTSAAWGAVKVRVDVAADMYWQSTKEQWHKEKDYPPIRLPYPAMWMEWEQPTEWKSGRKTMRMVHEFEFGMQLGCLLRETAVPQSRVAELVAPSHPQLGTPDQTLRVAFPKACTNAIEVHPYAMRNGQVNIFPFLGIMFCDSDGRQIREIEWAGPEGPMAEDTIGLLSSIMPPALLAVGLMNCKNVTTNEQESSIPIGPRRHRRNPGVRYHTIVVPGNDRRPDGASSGVGTAMHRVRGHFKTFTAAAPLMGQHTGTCWWGWQVRGNKKNGISVTDYKIGTAAAESVPA